MNTWANGPKQTIVRLVAMFSPKMTAQRMYETFVNMKPKKLTPRYKAIMKAMVIGVEAKAVALTMRAFLASTELSLLRSSRTISLSLFIKMILVANVKIATNGIARPA